jgi:hypothetical protein
MVHALREAQRVLASGGALVDLRPLLDRWPLEVAWFGGFEETGRAVDLQEPLADDAAANAAMAELEAPGRLTREWSASFDLFYYWDTPKEMEAYIADEWSDVIAVDASVWSSLRSRWSTASSDARVRMRMKMLITRYRK